MNQEHSGVSHYSHDIDLLIGRLNSISDENYYKKLGPYANVFPNPEENKIKWPEGANIPDEAHTPNNFPKQSSIQVHVIKLCDGCGTKETPPFNIHNWVTEGDEDYCQNCSYVPCHNCGCEVEHPDINHRDNCNRFNRKDGNCACPPCGCDCHA